MNTHAHFITRACYMFVDVNIWKHFIFFWLPTCPTWTDQFRYFEYPYFLRPYPRKRDKQRNQKRIPCIIEVQGKKKREEEEEWRTTAHGELFAFDLLP
jgi:hypothetical protein